MQRYNRIEEKTIKVNNYSKFKSVRMVDGRQRSVIVNICGDIINRNPTKEELKGLKHEIIRTWTLSKLPEQELKEYLLEFLRFFYDKEGRIPKTIDFYKNPKYPSSTLYSKVFKSWNNAIREAGLQPQWGGSNIYTDEELLELIIHFYEENGRPPVAIDFYKNPKYPGREL